MDELTAEQVYFDHLDCIVELLINDENPVNAAIADANASTWGREPAGEPVISDVAESSFNFESEIVLAGDNDEERADLGDQLTVQLWGSFKKVSGKWTLDSYEVLSVVSNYNDGTDD